MYKRKYLIPSNVSDTYILGRFLQTIKEETVNSYISQPRRHLGTLNNFLGQPISDNLLPRLSQGVKKNIFE